jgi:hypothetical protein
MSQSSSQSTPVHGIAGRVAAMFLDSKLTPLVVLASVLLGLAAVVLLPREEEPQIKVPMVDVMVGMPGVFGSGKWRSVPRGRWRSCSGRSRRGVPVLDVADRGVAGDRAVQGWSGHPNSSLVKLNQKLAANYDRIPHG